ncbi:hypothetical protein [Escherichia coli]|nr:hypothetical protein [Escherichia coli]
MRRGRVKGRRDEERGKQEGSEGKKEKGARRGIRRQSVERGSSPNE